MNQIAVFAFDHHTKHRLRAGGPQQDSPGFAQALLQIADGLGHTLVGHGVTAPINGDVDHVLRQLIHTTGKLCQ